MKNRRLFLLRLRLALAILGVLVLYSLIHEHAYRPLERPEMQSVPDRK